MGSASHNRIAPTGPRTAVYEDGSGDIRERWRRRGTACDATTDGGVVGHVTASQATVATDPVVAVGPIGVLPDHQGNGIGSALMDALLAAADAADVPLIVLLGAPQYYSRFGFRPAKELGVIPPEPE